MTLVAWIYEDSLPGSFPYDAMFPYSRVVDGVRMFPMVDPTDGIRYRAMRTQAWVQLDIEASEFDEEADELLRLYPEENKL